MNPKEYEQRDSSIEELHDLLDMIEEEGGPSDQWLAHSVRARIRHYDQLERAGHVDFNEHHHLYSLQYERLVAHVTPTCEAGTEFLGIFYEMVTHHRWHIYNREIAEQVAKMN